MRLLVVEDEKPLAQSLRKGLVEEGYAVDVAYDGAQGLFLAKTEEYDAIILDWRLPKRSGQEVCQELRGAGIDTPILILTVLEAVENKILGLDSGADDYLTKPFSFQELTARIRALLRRAQGQPKAPLQLDDLVLDPARHKVSRGGKTIILTGKEYALLEYLLRNQNKVVTRTAIAEHVWDINFDTNTNVIDVYINHLRQKLDCGSRRPLIHTVYGVGYIMELEERHDTRQNKKAST